MPELIATDAMITFVVIADPLQPKQREVIERDYIDGQSLKDYIGDLNGEWVIADDGKFVEKNDLSSWLPQRGTTVVLSPIPEGDDGKQILAVVAIVVLSFFTMGAGGMSGAGASGLWGTGLTGAAGWAAAAAVYIGGSMLINSMLAPEDPDMKVSGAGKSYGLGGPKNTSTANIPFPVVIGPYRMGGNYIQLYTTIGEELLEGFSPIPPQEPDNPYNPYNPLNAADQNASTLPYRQSTGEAYMHLAVNAGEGPIDGISEIEINDQPLSHYHGSEWTWRQGIDNQEIIPAFRNPIVAFPVNVEMREFVDVTRRTSTEVDKIRLDFVFPRGIYAQQEDGGIQSVEYHLRVRIKKVGDSVWVSMMNMVDWVSSFGHPYKISRSTKDSVRVSFYSLALEPGIYDVQVIPDRRYNRSVSGARSGERGYEGFCTWTDLNEIQIEQVNYNHTALLAVKVKMDDQLNSIPKITFINKGIQLRTFRESTQEWVVRQTNNPAWVVWNIMTNARWGARIPESRMDIYSFREWAIFCDDEDIKWVGVIEQQKSMWDTITPILKIGRASLIRIGTRHTISIETKKDPVMLFNNSNIIKDSFSQSWVSTNERANEINATYFDKSDGHRPKVVKVVHEAAQAAAGRSIPVNSTYFGIDNLDQAHRHAQFELNLNSLLSMSTLDTNLSGFSASVGDLVVVQHDQPEWGFGGRMVSGSTVSKVNLDRPVDIVGNDKLLVAYDHLEVGSGYIQEINGSKITLSGIVLNDNVIGYKPNKLRSDAISTLGDLPIRMSSDSTVELDNTFVLTVGDHVTLIQTDAVVIVDVTSNPGTHQTLSVTPDLPSAPKEYQRWAVGPSGQNATYHTIRGIQQTNDQVISLTLLEYNPDVFITTSGADTVPNSYTSGVLTPVTHVAASDTPLTLGNARRMYTTVTWSHSSIQYMDAKVMLSVNNRTFQSQGFYIDSFGVETNPGDFIKFIIVPRSNLMSMPNVEFQEIYEHTVGAVVQPVIEQFAGRLTWDFYGTYEGWDANSSINLAVNARTLIVNTIGVAPILHTTAQAFDSVGGSVSGQKFDIVRLKINRTAGTSWDGQLYYSTTTHGFDEAYYKKIPDVFELDQNYRIIELNMAELTAGGTDWVDSDITGLRLDLGVEVGDDFEIDYISIGTYTADPLSVNGVEAGATAGATWGSNIANQPSTLAEFDAAAQSALDGKIETFFQAAAPEDVISANGDLWFDTNDNNKLYRYNGTTWSLARDTGISEAIADAATAQSTADEKIVTFFQTATPSGASVGDLWYNSTNKTLKRYNGSIWQSTSTFNTGDLADLDNVGTSEITDHAVTDAVHVEAYVGMTVNPGAFYQVILEGSVPKPFGSWVSVTFSADLNSPLGDYGSIDFIIEVKLGDLWIEMYRRGAYPQNYGSQIRLPRFVEMVTSSGDDAPSGGTFLFRVVAVSNSSEAITVSKRLLTLAVFKR